MRNCLITFVSVVLLLGLLGCKKNPGDPANEDTARWSVINSSGFKMGSNYVNTSIVDDAGDIWIGTRGGLTRISSSGDVLFTSSNSDLPGDDIRDLEFYNNNLWIGTTAGLAKYDGSKFTVYNTINSGLCSNIVNQIDITGNGNLWIATANGLSIFDLLNWQYYKTANTSLPEDALLSVLAAAGNWVGTKTQGLVCVGSNPKIGPYNILNTGNSQLASNKITVICQDRNSVMWIGTDHGIQKMVADTTFTGYTSGNSGLGGDMITSMTFDSRNTMFVGTEGGGFSVFDGSTWKVYTASTSSLPGDDVNDIYIDNTGRILVSTVNGLATVRF